jgi:hypothetical protein
MAVSTPAGRYITLARKMVKYKPDAPASAWLIPPGIHSLALRARMMNFLAGVINGLA